MPLNICLASITSAKRFVSSFYDVYLSTSASLEMICQITLTKFLFNFFITLLILVRIYVRGQCLFLKLTPVCYSLLVVIKLNIRVRHMFASKSSKKVRICKLANFTCLHIQPEQSIYYIMVFQKCKIFSYFFKISFAVYSCGNMVMLK